MRFLLVQTPLFAGFCLSQLIHNQYPIGSSFPPAGVHATYDYVVVGAGTAGAALATRLAQDGRYTVAVIEAGSFYELDNGNRSVIPGYDSDSAGFTNLEGVNPLIDWEFVTTPQAGAGNRTEHYPRGKCLGGSSARNYMVYQRPTVGSMQLWADRVGDESWTWDNVLPYYKKSATLTPPNMSIRAANTTPLYDLSVFGGGPLQASYAHYASPLAPSIFNAWTEAGDPVRNNGMQSGELLGHGYLPSSLDPTKQERSTSQTSYLDLALKTTQLNVYTHSLVKRVLFDSNKAAIGVDLVSDEIPYTISTNREVILSAGAFQSPQLLMVSGVGPKETLSKYGIPVIHDLPGVGKNMQDNPLFGISFGVDVETGTTYQNNPIRFAEAIQMYNTNRTGFLTSSGADTISFEKLVDMPQLNLSTKAKQDLAWVPSDWPDVMFWGFGVFLGSLFGAAPPSSEINYGSIIGGLTAPLSRGYVTINSSDMADAPIINPNWMTDPTDQELAVAGMWRIREFMNTTSIQSVIVGGEAYPGANITSYDALLQVIQKEVVPFAHASATNKMGMANDSMAVIDSKARVFGVNNLRVVDISGMPFLPPGQPQATVYLLGEKIADDILYGSNNGIY